MSAVRGAGTLAVIGSLVLVTTARGQLVAEGSVTMRLGAGAGYTAAPSYSGESAGGGWNGEAFVLLGFSGIPVELRPAAFSYGRGTGPVVYYECPNPGGACGGGVNSASGVERATGGGVDASIRFARGPVVPYAVGGVSAVAVSRGAAGGSTVHGAGAGYELGGGLRAAVGRLLVFGEGKFFETSATAGQFDGHAVHMAPLTVGIAF